MLTAEDAVAPVNPVAPLMVRRALPIRRTRSWIAIAALCATVARPALALQSESPAQARQRTAGKTYAQVLVDETVVRHPELIGLDLHATPPNSQQSVIIASKNPERIGNKTDPDDLEVFKTGTPRIEINPAGDQNVEVAFQLQDVTGRPIGTVEMTFPYPPGTDKEALVEQAEEIRDELRRHISGEGQQGGAELVAPASVDPRVPIDTYAQFLVDDTLARHPGVVIIVLHIKLPGTEEYPILASNIGRIGKPADDSDRAVIETGKPVAAVSKDVDRLEVKLRLQDVSGDTVGAVAIVFPLKGPAGQALTHREASTQRALAAQAEGIRDQLRRRIADVANLYEPHPYERGILATVPPNNHAQALVDKILGRHAELLILALRTNPPKATDYPIIASNIGRVGKKSDADDLRVIQTGQPNVRIDPSTGRRIEVELPLQDKSGKTIGAMSAVYAYTKGDDEARYVKQAVSLREELGGMIPQAERLVEPIEPLQTEYDLPELGNVQELPMTKAVVAGQALEQAAQEGYSEAIKNVAGVAPANSKGSPNDSVYIRGIKLNLFSNYRLNGGLATAGVITTPNEDKERIEALKGANALMFGVASPAGIINLVTKRAGPVDVTSVSIAGNHFGQIGVAGDLGRRFGAEKELGVRLNASATYLNNGVRNMYGDGEFASVGLDWRASQRLLLQGDFEYYRKHVPEQAGVSLLTAVNGRVPITPVPDPRNLLSGRWAIYTPDTKNAQVRADYILTEYLKLIAEVGGSWAQRSRYTVRIGGYDLATGMGGVVTVQPVTQRYQNAFARTELLSRFATWLLGHQLTIGAALADRQSATPSQNNTILPQRQNLYDPIALDPPVFTNPPTSLPLQTSTDIGVYAYDTVSIGSKLKLLGGLRVTHDKENNGVKKSSTTVVTPAVGALFDPVPSLTLFASYMEGLEVGATAPVNAANRYEILGPAVSTQKEIGIRDSHLRGISASASYFDITRANAVVNPTTTVFEAAGDIHYYGVEATARIEFLRRFVFNTALQWMRSVQRNPDDPTIDGKPPENTPRVLGNAGLSYRVPWIAGLTLNVGGSGVTKRSVNPQNQGTIPGYVLYTAGVSYARRMGTSRLALQLNVDNLTNLRYWNSVQTGTYGTGMDRSLKFSARVDF
jgi:iron complex outermembrane receptor protein